MPKIKRPTVVGNVPDKSQQVAEIIHHKGQLMIPEGMSVDAAIGLLERRRDYLQEVVAVRRTYNVFPWDGANALAIALWIFVFMTICFIL